jgi:hypothetical protein
VSDTDILFGEVEAEDVGRDFLLLDHFVILTQFYSDIGILFYGGGEKEWVWDQIWGNSR